MVHLWLLPVLMLAVLILALCQRVRRPGLALALGKAVISVADQSAGIHTKRFRGTDIHQKLKQAIEIGGNSYAYK